MNNKNIFPILYSALETEIMENSGIIDIPEKIEVMRERVTFVTVLTVWHRLYLY